MHRLMRRAMPWALLAALMLGVWLTIFEDLL